MFSRLSRSIFYTTQRSPRLRHSDSRDAHEYVKLCRSHQDTRYAISTWWFHFKLQAATWGAIIFFIIYLFRKSRILREQFEIRYLTSMPPKDYDPSDYDYKSWELVLTKPLETTGQILSTDIACKNNYVLLYHAETTGSHLAMQRFARLEKYVLLRKLFPIKSVFVGMDKDIDPEVLEEYVKQYSQTVMACYPNDEDVRGGISSVFQNIGCIYLLEKDTGNVIYIMDPSKHPLETMGTRLLFTISKNEDFRTSKEIVDKSINVKEGHQDELRAKLPTY